MDREDRDRRFANDAFCNTPQNEMLHSRAAVRSHHDQVDFFLSREIENFVRRIPARDEHLM